MNPFVDMEDEFKRAEKPVMPEGMRTRILQAIRSEEVKANKPRRTQRTWVSWAAVAAGIVIAGTAGTWVSRHSYGLSATHPGPTATANPAPTSLATTILIVGKHVATSHMDVVYPQVEGLPNPNVEEAINNSLKKASMPNNSLETTGQTHFEASYVITYQKGNLVDIVITTEDTNTSMNDGGTPVQMSFIYNLATGKRYELSDLFKTTPSALSTLSTLVKRADKDHVLGQPGFVYPVVQATDTIILTNEGVAIAFPEGKYTARAVGNPVFILKVSQLPSIVNTDSPLWTSVEASNTQSVDFVRDLQYVQSQGYQPASEALNAYQPRLTSVMVPVKDASPVYAVIGVSPKSDPTAPDLVEKIFFFQGTKYIGTDTTKAHGLVSNMYLSSRDTLHIDYINWNVPRNQAFAIDYKWNGTKLVRSSSFPSTYTDWH